MKIYAELPARRIRQVIGDVVMLAWVCGGVYLALWLDEQASRVAEPGRRLESTGNDLADRFADAGDRAGDVPGIGDALAAPFETGVGAAEALTGAGQGYQDTVQTAANLLIALTLVSFLGIVLIGWLPFRLRWIRRATVGAQLRADPAGRDLLALRALASRPVRAVHRLGDPANGWRREDPATIDALAALELRAVGLRGPA